MPIDNFTPTDTSLLNPGERLARLEEKLEGGLKNLKEALERQQKMFEDFKNDFRSDLNVLKDGFASKERVDVIEKRVDKLEGNITWAIRIVVGAVILATLGLVLVAK